MVASRPGERPDCASRRDRSSFIHLKYGPLTATALLVSQEVNSAVEMDPCAPRRCSERRMSEMDAPRFDALVQSLAGSRRLLLAGGLTLAAGPIGDSLIEAKNKKRKRKNKKKKPKKATPNEFGCLEVNASCTSPEECCSSVCDGKLCRAHNPGSCDQNLEKETCLASSPADIVELRCDNDPNCGCYRTTAGSRYCSAFLANEDDPRCADCKTDADCVALGFPPEAACAPVSRGICAGACPTGMACLVPCGVELP